MRLRWLLFSMAALAVAATEGCAWPEPYVYRFQEFERGLANFGKEPAERRSVGICYNKKNATPERIADMARAECAKYGRVARYIGQKRLECPITTPMEAVYACDVQPGYSQSSWPLPR